MSGRAGLSRGLAFDSKTWSRTMPDDGRYRRYLAEKKRVRSYVYAVAFMVDCEAVVSIRAVVLLARKRDALRKGHRIRLGHCVAERSRAAWKRQFGIGQEATGQVSERGSERKRRAEGRPVCTPALLHPTLPRSIRSIGEVSVLYIVGM